MGKSLLVLFPVAVCLILPTAIQAVALETILIFITHPENQTVHYGEIIEFECHVPSYRNYSLDIYVGNNTKVYPNFNENGRKFRQRLHPGEFYANFTQLDNGRGKGIFWMVVNSITLQVMDFMWCRAYYNNKHVDSYVGYIINVTYPDEVGCNTSPSTTATPIGLSPSPTLTHSIKSQSMTVSSLYTPIISQTPLPAIVDMIIKHPIPTLMIPTNGAEHTNITSILVLTSLLLYPLLCIDL